MADDNTTTETKPDAKPDDTALKSALDKERKRAQDAENQVKQLRVEMATLRSDKDATKSEQQQLTERIEAAEKRAADAEVRQLRAEVAASKGVPAGLLTGSTKEELESYADQLIEFRGVKPTDDAGKTEAADAGKEGAGTEGERPLPPSGRPKEKLTSGTVPSAEGDKSSAELAESILTSDF